MTQARSFDGNNFVSMSDLEEMQYKKACELFVLCDKENKGFVNKLDLQRLQPELSLPPETLEQVFNILDKDRNGYLTLKEFTEGFHRFVGFPKEEEHIYGEDYVEIEDEAFSIMFDTVGAKDVIQDSCSVNNIKKLWIQLRKEEDPDIIDNFEDFLCKITKDMKKKQDDLRNLESALKLKTLKWDDEVKNLYEEMEYQIKREKEAILNKEKTKESNFRDEMEKELFEKEYQLQNLLTKQKELENKLNEINYSEMEAKTTNDRLAKDKDDLLYRLKQSQECIDEQNSYIQHLHQQQKDEKRERSKIAIKFTEGLALERESLVKQLEHLRSVNRKLQDDKDEAEARRDHLMSLQEELSEVSGQKAIPKSEVARPKLKKGGSVLSDYFNPDLRRNSHEYNKDNVFEDIESDIECFDDLEPIKEVGEDIEPINHIHQQKDSGISSDGKNRRQLWYSKSSSQSSITTIEENESEERKQIFVNSERNHINDDNRSKTPIELEDRSSSMSKQKQNSLLCVTEPNTQQTSGNIAGNEKKTNNESPKTPERFFKIVFVGDSGVGKSSFIHQFCDGEFKPTFSTTIGVDFRIKSIEIDGHLFALQLWDTAGQERFRSITKQYFRKADGVLIMYDVTSEHSLVNVRNWITNVNESVDPNTVLLIIGNKSDMQEEDHEQTKQFKTAKRLAMENNALFYETSAKNGSQVNEAMYAMAFILKEKEDEEMEKVLELRKEPVKKKCCS